MSSDSDRSERFDADEGRKEANRSGTDDRRVDALIDSGESNERNEFSELSDVPDDRAAPNERPNDPDDAGGIDERTDADDEVETDERRTDESGTGAPSVRWTGGGAGPDRSVLNRAAIRRFTEGVLTAYGGAVDRETNGRWSVRLPAALAAELDRERATFVFDASDREVASDDVVVAPGTWAFTALCALARDGAPASRTESEATAASSSASVAESASTSTRGAQSAGDGEAGLESGTAGGDGVGRVHLGNDVLQLHTPPILDAAGFETTVEDFVPRGTERALAFHFRATFLSVRSYQRTEHVTVAVDPATRSVLPALAARFESHLPRLLDPRNGHCDGRDDRTAGAGGTGDPDEAAFDREAVRGAYSTAKSAAIKRVEPTTEELRATEEAAVADRIEEVREYYGRRRGELDERIDAKRATVEELSDKYDRAQGDETRLRYLREQREAENELDSLTERVEERKAQLRDEERARVSEALERHRVDVDLELVRVTHLTYERGTLALSVTDGDVTARPTVSSVPATDEFYRLDCACCGADVTALDGTGTTADPSESSDARVVPDADRPLLCVGGHLVCGSCASVCRTCGEVWCSSCLDAARTAAPTGEAATEDGIEPGTDGETRAGMSAEIEESAGIEGFETCTLCREPVCADCATSCTGCSELVCTDHRAVCDACDAVACLVCGEPCAACERFHCDAHLVAPSGPATETDASGASTDSDGTDRSDDPGRYCEAHVVACTECGERRGIDAIAVCGACDEPLCERHEHGCAVCGAVRCSTHAVTCAHCGGDANTDDGSTGDVAGEASATFCEEHAERCVGGDEVVCEAHSRPGVIVDGWVCDEHRATCELCGVAYAEAGFTEGRCPACVGLSPDAPAEPAVATIAEEFAVTRIGTTPTHAVIQGKKRLRRDEIVVVDRATGEEVRRFKADFFSKLSGGP